MTKSLIYTLFAFFLITLVYSCKKETGARVVIKVMEKQDTVKVPVKEAFVRLRPDINEPDELILDGVIKSGYTNSLGEVSFEFDRDLALRADAFKYLKDEKGQTVYDNGKPFVLKKGNRTIVLKLNNTESRTIEIK